MKICKKAMAKSPKKDIIKKSFNVIKNKIMKTAPKDVCPTMKCKKCLKGWTSKPSTYKKG